MPVERPQVIETTALGAARLAALGAGLAPSPDALADGWRPERRFEPRMEPARRERLLRGWRDAIARVLTQGHAGLR